MILCSIWFDVRTEFYDLATRKRVLDRRELLITGAGPTLGMIFQAIGLVTLCRAYSEGCEPRIEHNVYLHLTVS